MAKKLLSLISRKIRVWNIPHAVIIPHWIDFEYTWKHFVAPRFYVMVQWTPVSLNPTLTCCSFPPGDNSESNCSQSSLKSFFSDSYEENKKIKNNLWPSLFPDLKPSAVRFSPILMSPCHIGVWTQALPLTPSGVGLGILFCVENKLTNAATISKHTPKNITSCENRKRVPWKYFQHECIQMNS